LSLLGCVDISSSIYAPRFMRGIHRMVTLIMVYFKQALKRSRT